MSTRNIKYKIGFEADVNSLTPIKRSLEEISKIGVTQFKLINPQMTGDAVTELRKVKDAASEVQNVLSSSFNAKFNTIDLTKFQNQLKSSGQSLSQLKSTLGQAGATGRAAFLDLTSSLLTAKGAVKDTNKLLDSMAKTFANTIKWSISSSVLNSFSGTIQQAWGFAKKLDESLNNIRIVTGKSNEEMEKFAKNANKAAKSLGSSTTSYTNAALIYYQQGLGETDVQARTKTTVKAANVTGQSAAEVSEQLTAVWNGYKVVAEEAELYVDKLAAVAATTAADLEELSTGMSKVASAANAMGVDIDQLSAQLSTIVSVTRQDASVVGTALKTIFSRMGDLKVDGVDEFGVSLGDVSSQLEQMGIKVLDQQGNLRDMGNVIEEVAAKWGTWTDAQQQAATVAIAGKRQYNNLIALFENWDMYESALTTSKTSEGTLQKQQDIYMDSIEAKLAKLKTASEGLFNNLIDSDSAKSLIEVLTKIVEAVDNLAQGLGGLGNILKMAGGIIARLFSSQIAGGAGRLYSNFLAKDFNKSQRGASADIRGSLSQEDLELEKKSPEFQKAINKAIDLEAQKRKMAQSLTKEEKEQYDILIKKTLELAKQKDLLEDQQKDLLQNTDFLISEKGNKKVLNEDPKERIKELDILREESRQAAIITGPISLNKTRKQRKGTLDRIESVNLIEDSKIKMDELINDKDKNYSSILEKVRNEESLKADEFEAFNEFLEKAKELLQENTDQLDEYTQGLDDSVNALENTQSEQKSHDDDVNRINKIAKFSAGVEQVSQLAGSLMLGASAATSLTTAIKALGDESLSVADKIQQVSTGIVSSAAMMTTTLMRDHKTWQDAKASGSKGGMVMSGISMGLSIGSFIGQVGGELIGALHPDKAKKYAADAEKAHEEAQRSIEATQSTVKDLTNEYDNLESSISQFQNNRNILDQMAEGTDAWKEKVAELNQQVSELLVKYPQLANYVTTGSNGVLEVSQEGWDALLEEQKKEVAEAQRSANLANIQGQIAQRNLQSKTTMQGVRENSFASHKEDLTSDKTFGTLAGVGGAAAGATTAALVASGPIGWGALAAGAVVGLVGLAAGLDSWQSKTYKEKADKETEKVEKAIEKIDTEEDLKQYSAATTIAEIKGIEGLEDISDKTAKAMLDNKEALVRNITETQANTRAIQQMTKMYLQDLGQDFGIQDTVTYANISANDITEDDLDREKYLKNYVVAGKDETVKGEKIGKYINSSNDRKYARDAVNAWIEQGFGIEGTLTAADLKGLTEAKFEEKEFVLADGRKVTGQQIREAAANAEMEKVIKEKTQANIDLMLELEKAGKDTNLAYFMGNNTAEEWKDTMTLAGLQSMSQAAAGVAGVDRDALNRKLAAEKDRLNKFIADTGLQYSIDTISAMTAQDRTTFQHTLAKAEGSGRRDDLLEVLAQYENDPEKFANVARQAAAVDFSDKFAAADFFFEHTEEIQTKIRKKELDYFKNINAELDSLNKKLERVIGLEKKALLDRQIALEQEAQTQAIQEEKDARQVLETYLEAHGDDDEYLNTDGTLDVAAINDRIASLDEEADKTEIEYLNNILLYWDDVIAKEAAAEEAGYKVVDAQMAAFEYQFEAWEHLKALQKKYNDFFREIGDLSTGFAAFDEETIKERFDKAMSVWNNEDDPLDINMFLGKIKSELFALTDSQEIRDSFITFGNEAKTRREVVEDKEQAKKDADAAVATFLSEKGYKGTIDEYITQQNINKEQLRTKKLGYSDRFTGQYENLKYYASKAQASKANLDEYIESIGGTPKGSIWDQMLTKMENGDSAAADDLLLQYYDERKDRLGYDSKFYSLASKAIDDLERQNYWHDEASKTQLFIDTINEDIQTIDGNIDEADNLRGNVVLTGADLYREKEGYNEWAQNYTSEIAKAFKISTENLFKLDENGVFDFDAFKAEFGKIVSWFNLETGEIEEGKLSEAIEKDFETVMEKVQSLQESLKEMYDIWMDSQDQILKLYDKEIEKISSINSLLKGSADLSKIIGVSSKDYYSGITQGLQTSLDYAQQSAAKLRLEYEKLYTLDEQGNRVLANGITDEMVDKVTENLTKATENSIKIAQELLNAIADEFSATMSETIDTAFKTATSLSLAGGREKWEMSLESDEGYLDEVNATYGIDTLDRKIQQSIDETSNASVQKKLMDLRAKQEERLNKILEERGKLSQYELDRANAEYELTLKRIALEEAQQTANKMKLARDAMGNYTYQYVADQDVIAKAEEELAAAQNDLYNLDKERNESLVTDYYTLWTEYQSKMDEAVRANDTERIARLQEHYLGPNGMISMVKTELGTVAANITTIGSEIMGSDDWVSKYAEISNQLSTIPLNELATNIQEYINTTTGEGSVMAGLRESIRSLLADDGAIPLTIGALQETAKTADDLAAEVLKIQNATSTILLKVPELAQIVNPLVTQLQTYTKEYTKWLEAQTEQPEIIANTKALEKLTIVMEDLSDNIVDGLAKNREGVSVKMQVDGWKWDEETNQWMEIDGN